MDINQRKKELMLAKRNASDKYEATQRFAIVTMIDAKYQSNLKDGMIEKVAMDKAALKIKKDLLTERDGYVKADRPDKLVAIDIQIDELNKFLPELMTNEEFSNWVKQYLSDNENAQFSDIMKAVKIELQDKVDMGQVVKIVKQQL